MSHFSRIKTTIRNLNILQITLSDLGLDYKCGQYFVKDYNGNMQEVDIIIKGNNNSLYGFIWNGKEYLLLADLQLWDQSISIEKFVDTITQHYAYNIIMEASKSEGFNCIDHNIMDDGSMNLIMQRWNY